MTLLLIHCIICIELIEKPGTKEMFGKMEVHYSSKKQDWETPNDLFDLINEEFNLRIDVCASADNTKCMTFFDPKIDGLKQDWSGLRCWMNPPYGREIGSWVEKAFKSNAEIVVALLPARTDTVWFHKYIYNRAKIRFIRGRIKFMGGKHAAPFPSMIVIWD